MRNLESSRHIDLDVDAAEVRRARELAADFAREENLDGLTDSLLLITSELVSNAVRYARGAISVELTRGQLGVTVLVTDDGRGEPRLGSPDPLAVSGRGLMIVDGLATRWGSRPTLDGKVVWAELSDVS